jgi:acetyl esterase/lipase
MSKLVWALIVVAVVGGIRVEMMRAERNERLAKGWCTDPLPLSQRERAIAQGELIDDASGCMVTSVSRTYTDHALEAEIAREKAAEAAQGDLDEARRGFVTELSLPPNSPRPLPSPPPSLFVRADYASGAHSMPAFVTPDPADGKRHPAIIWLVGGDFDGLGEFWTPGPPEADESASPLRDAGVITMFVTLRGRANNASKPEYFLGEVDDVLAAAERLSTLPYVDPAQVYLGGHSTGGTLALLVAQSSRRFKAVFALGPVGKLSAYDTITPPAIFHLPNIEARLRSPQHWMGGIASPTYLIEGLKEPGNSAALDALCRASTNPMVHCLPIPGADHFSVLQPALKVIGARIAIPVPGQPFSLTVTDIRLQPSP